MSKIGITTATQKIRNLSKRIRIVQGGSSASKTFSIIMYLIDLAQRDKVPTLTSIVSESLPHLKRGAIVDFLNIMQQQNRFVDANWYKSDPITYTFETGSKIEFFSIDQPRKVRGPRRDRLFINEANNTPFESFEQLEIRTKEFVILDYNPTNEFWVQNELLGKREDIDFIILTYKDNEALDEAIVQSLEQRRNRPGWWKVYGEGQLGEVEGRIYKDWKIIDEIPHEARLERHWLDFGYTNDPTAIGDIYYYNGGYIFDEQTYQKGLSNKQIADIILNLNKAITVADSAEPKSIDEIKSFGVNIIPAVKGVDSIKYGIQMIQDQQISVTKRSVNLIKEYRNYLWMTDKDGRIMNEPEGIWNHHMDGIRYAMSSLIPYLQRMDLIKNMPRLYQKKKVNPAR
jgi:phage terminase large subunit